MSLPNSIQSECRPEALAAYYARRAPEYERIYDKPERQSDLRLLQERITRIFTGRRVLEVACGTGWWTQVLSTCAHSVAATDINDEVLAIARAKTLGRHVTLHRRDAFALDSMPGKYDGALAAFWWSHLTQAQLDKFLPGLHRKLQPGSDVVFIDNIFVAGSSTPISRRDAEGNTFQLRKLDDGSTIEVLKNFPSDEEVATALRDRARDLVIERFDYYWLARYRCVSLL